MPPSASVAAATNAAPPAAPATSHTSPTQSPPIGRRGLVDAHLVATADGHDAPSAASALADASPNPPDAAATAARVPEMPRSIGVP